MVTRYGERATLAPISAPIPPPGIPPLPASLPSTGTAAPTRLAKLSTDFEFLSSFFDDSSTDREVWSTFCRNRSNAADAFLSVAMISKTSCSKFDATQQPSQLVI